MSKSDNIYNALDYARNKLKSATEAKGAIVSSPYSLMDIAAAVQTIENGLEVGVLVSDSTDMKVQPLEFSGTSATANGTAESYAAKIFNTGKDEPAYASGGTSADIVKLTVASGSTGEQISNVFSQIPYDLQGKTYAVEVESGVYTLTSSIILNHSNGKILLYCDSFTDFDNMSVTLNASTLELTEGSYCGLELNGSAAYEIQNMKFLDTRSGSDSKAMVNVKSTSSVYFKNCCFEGYNGDYTNDYWGILRDVNTGEPAADESVLSPMIISNCKFNNIYYAVGNVKDAFTLTYMRDTTGNVNRCFTTFGKSKGVLIYHNVQGSVWDTSKTMSLDFPVDGVFTDLNNAL